MTSDIKFRSDSINMANHEQIYPKVNAEVATGVLFAVAVVTASIRTVMRIRFHKTLFADDALLIFACLTLILLFSTVYHYESTIYLVEAILDGQLQEGLVVSQASGRLSALISRYRKVQFFRGCLSWLTIFAVKFSFLSFFYPLTDRLPRLSLYWKMVVAVNVLASAYCITCGFFGCLNPGEETLQCLTGSSSERLSFLIGFATALDVLTDILSSYTSTLRYKTRLTIYDWVQ